MEVLDQYNFLQSVHFSVTTVMGKRVFEIEQNTPKVQISSVPYKGNFSYLTESEYQNMCSNSTDYECKCEFGVNFDKLWIG